jgi:2'-5' RNA ligase
MSPTTPQGYAVELYFDAETERSIRAFRDSIYKMGVVPVLGALDDRPHVSLAVFGQSDPQKLKKVTALTANQFDPLPVRLEAVGVFPSSSNVLFLYATPSQEILNVHKAFHAVLNQEGIPSSAYYWPDQWVPHCTLEFELPDTQLRLALDLCKQHFTPIRGKFTHLGVIAFRPIKYLADYPLDKQEVK